MNVFLTSIRLVLATVVVLVAASKAGAQNNEPPRSARVPEVLLSEQHQQMTKVGVGDTFPDITLPSAAGGESVSISQQLGSQATVVAVWTGEGAKAKTMLRDLSIDVRRRYASNNGNAAAAPAVATIAIAVETSADVVAELTRSLGYDGTVLLDQNAEVFSQLGSGRLPRIYVLNGSGEIVWFDIEYSLSTRRELKQTLTSLAPRRAAQ